jgi:REP element-mobilizing transposase RayT
MPRRPRVLSEGGIYHVLSRFASGEPVFADPEKTLEFIELLWHAKKRDGWTVFAWVLVSNHCHLAIRSKAIPISRGFQHLQGRFSQRFNRGRKRTGTLRQSADTVTYIQRQGVQQQRVDDGFSRRYEDLDRALVGCEP